MSEYSRGVGPAGHRQAAPQAMADGVSTLGQLARMAGVPAVPLEVHEYGWASWGKFADSSFWPHGSFGAAYNVASWLWQRSAGARRVFHWGYTFDDGLAAANPAASGATANHHGRPIISGWGWTLGAMELLLGADGDSVGGEMVSDTPSQLDPSYNNTLGAFRAAQPKGRALHYLVCAFSGNYQEHSAVDLTLRISAADFPGSQPFWDLHDTSAVVVSERVYNSSTSAHDAIRNDLAVAGGYPSLLSRQDPSVDMIEKMTTPRGLAAAAANTRKYLEMSDASLQARPFTGGLSVSGGALTASLTMQRPSLVLLSFAPSTEALARRVVAQQQDEEGRLVQRSKSGNGDAAASPYLPATVKSDDDAAPTNCSLHPLSVHDFGAQGDGVADDHDAIQAAIDAASAHPCGGGQVYFPPATGYRVSKPLVIMTGEGVVRGGLSLVGGGGSARHPERPQFAYPPQTVIFTDALTGPALQVGNLSVGSGINDVDLFIRDMSFVGVETGLAILGSAGVRLQNIAAACRNYTGGADNAGAVISNTYWLSCDQCAFSTVAAPDAFCRHFPGSKQPPLCYGTKPSLILRGENPGGAYGGVHECYLLRFDGIILKAGGIRYEQLWAAPQGKGPKIGFFEFRSIVLEYSWTPFLDLWVDPALEASQNFSLITIDHHMGADANPKNSSIEWSPPPLVRFNCSQPHCTLGGVTLSGLGMAQKTVEVVNGQLGGFGGGVTVLGNELGANAVDEAGHSAGGIVARSSGGLEVVGRAGHTADPLALGADSTAALAVSTAGDSAARLAVGASGAMSWGDGAAGAAPTATLGTVRAETAAWDPPSLEPGGICSTNVSVPSATTADIVSASLTTLGFIDAQLTAAVAAPGIVKVLLRNVGATPADVPAGELRVVATPFAAKTAKTDDAAATAPSWVTKLLPRPQQLLDLESTFSFTGGRIVVAASEEAADALQAGDRLQSRMRRLFGLHLQVVAAPPSANRSYAAGDIVLSVAPRALPGIASKAVSEAYVLKVHREAILLEAATSSGLRTGVQTLLQLTQSTSSGAPTMRSCIVTDWPDSPMRGLFMYGSESNDVRSDSAAFSICRAACLGKTLLLHCR